MAISFLTGESVDGNIALPDNKKIILGTGSDLQIYHDGSNSYIAESGTGRLIISGGSDVQIQSPSGELMADFNGNSSVDLYYDNSKKFETTSAGVTVTGNIDLPSNGAILFDNTSNIEQYYIRNGGSSQSSLQIGKGTPGSDIKFSLDDAGNASFASSVTFSNGQINLGSGVGRIQGVDTVSSNTDAANKLYVDNAVATGVGAYLPLAGGTMSSGATITGTDSLIIKADTQILLRGDAGSNIASIKTVNTDYDIIELLDNNRMRWRDGMEIYLDDSAATDYMMFTTETVGAGNHALHRFAGYEFQGTGLATIMKMGGALNATNIELYQNGTKRLETTQAGVDITGDITISENISLVGEIIQTSTGNENSFSSELNMNDNKINSLANPTSAKDAANKSYVDAHTSGVQVINEGVGIKKSGSSTSVTISANYDSGDTDNLIFGANAITAAVSSKPYTPYILAAESNPGVSFGEVKNLRLQSIPLDRFGDATSTIDMGGNKILDVADPTLAQDAATKAYVDANSGSGTVTGTGASTRVAFWSSSSALTSDADLTFTTATNRLSSRYYIIPNDGDYLGTDTSGNARTLISLTSGNDVEVSNTALSSGSDTIIYFGDTFRIKDGGAQRFSIASNGTMSNSGNTFNSGPINLEEDNKITFDDDSDQWNWIQATSGEMEMAVGQTLTLTNVEEGLFGEIAVERLNTILGNNISTSNATYVPVYTDSASSTVTRRQRVQTPSQFLSNAGAITGSGTSGRVAFFTGTRTQSSDTLYWNSSTNVLGINYSGSTFNSGALQIQGPTNNSSSIGLQIYNSTTGAPYGAHGIFVNGPRYGNAGISIKNPNVGTTLSRFYSSSGSSVGPITQNGTSSTSYNTSSDYRLKENIIPMTGSIDRLKQLKPSRFNFIDQNKEDRGVTPTVDGFIAHEVSDIIPEAITGEKDGLDYEGNPEYQSIDQSKIVPLLTGALQEAISKIESLEARIKALES